MGAWTLELDSTPCGGKASTRTSAGLHPHRQDKRRSSDHVLPHLYRAAVDNMGSCLVQRITCHPLKQSLDHSSEQRAGPV